MKLLLLLSLFTLAITTRAQEEEEDQELLLPLDQTIVANEDLSTLFTAVELAGLGEYLSNTADLTVFAPTNAALEALPPQYLTPGFLPHLRNILEYHVLQGAVVPALEVTDGLTVDMLNGESITATVNDDMSVFLSGAAFTDSQVIFPDVLASNGVAHVVDQFFFPQALTLSLYDLTGQVTGFESVLDLILQSGLEDELRADNRTVLAPSDAAFAALPPEFLAEVAEDADLRDSIVLYHVIIGSYPLEMIEDGLEVMTASGNPLSFEVIGGGRFAQYSAVGPTNTVPIGVGNLIASNGIAHTIEAVLEAPPMGDDAPDTPTDETDEMEETTAPATETDTTPAPNTPTEDDGAAPSPAPDTTTAAPTEEMMDSTPAPDMSTMGPSAEQPTTESSSAWMISSVVAVVASVVAALI